MRSKEAIMKELEYYKPAGTTTYEKRVVEILIEVLIDVRDILKTLTREGFK